MSPTSRPLSSVMCSVRPVARADPTPCTFLQNGGCSTNVPTYRARISGATFTSFCRSSAAVPTQCTTLRLAPSLHTHSSISVSAAYSAPTFTVHGLAYVPGSENVTSISSVPNVGRWYRSVTRNCSVWGWPSRSSQDPAWKPWLSTTSASPSQCPTEYP